MQRTANVAEGAADERPRGQPWACEFDNVLQRNKLVSMAGFWWTTASVDFVKERSMLQASWALMDLPAPEVG